MVAQQINITAMMSIFILLVRFAKVVRIAKRSLTLRSQMMGPVGSKCLSVGSGTANCQLSDREPEATVMLARTRSKVKNQRVSLPPAGWMVKRRWRIQSTVIYLDIGFCLFLRKNRAKSLP
jgi:hypothetical protein